MLSYFKDETSIQTDRHPTKVKIPYLVESETSLAQLINNGIHDKSIDGRILNFRSNS